MTTRADIRARIRQELGDSVAEAYLWPDDVLNQFIDNAIGEYSLRLPRQVTSTMTLVDGTTTYDAPENLVRIQSIEFPEGVFLDHAAPVSGDDFSGLDVSPRQAWDCYAGKILLRRNPGNGTATLRYLALHEPLPDDAVATTVPEEDVTLLVWHACDQALRRLDVQRDKQVYQDRAGRMGASAYRLAYTRGLAGRLRRPRSSRLEVS